MNPTPTLALPLMGREFFAEKHQDFSFPLRGKVGMGVVRKFSVISVFSVAISCS
jgi:hypothetical protein